MIVASLFGATVGASIGLAEDAGARLRQWSGLALTSLLLGLTVWGAGVPLNPNLYSLSFMLTSNGVVASVLVVLSLLVDGDGDGDGDGNGDSDGLGESESRRSFFLLLSRRVAYPLRCMGLNSILIYLLSCSDMLQWLASLVYWGSEDNTVASGFYPGPRWGADDDSDGFVPTRERETSSASPGVLCWLLLFYIPLWMCVAVFLHKKKFYWKI